MFLDDEFYNRTTSCTRIRNPKAAFFVITENGSFVVSALINSAWSNPIIVFPIDKHVDWPTLIEPRLGNSILTRVQESTFAPYIVARALRNLASRCYLCAIPLLRVNRDFHSTLAQVNRTACVCVEVIDTRINLVQTGANRFFFPLSFLHFTVKVRFAYY